MSPTRPDSSVTIRSAKPTDSVARHWLSRLGRGPRLIGPALLAEQDGVPVAAIALTSGAVAADPWNSSDDVVRALKFLRYRALRQSGHSCPVRSLWHRGQLTHTTSTTRAALAAVRA